MSTTPGSTKSILPFTFAGLTSAHNTKSTKQKGEALPGHLH